MPPENRIKFRMTLKKIESNFLFCFVIPNVQYTGSANLDFLLLFGTIFYFCENGINILEIVFLNYKEASEFIPVPGTGTYRTLYSSQISRKSKIEPP